ncbi:MAG: ABC transporter substrate-binding protein [Rhizomicrobium sp.]
MLLLLGVAACSKSEPRPLTVVGWGGTSQDALRDAYWAPFQKQTGIALREDAWHGGVGILRAKSRAGDPGWDVVQVETEELILGCEEGIFARLDWKALGGREAYIKPAVQDCGVGAMAWSYLIGYDGDRFKDGPKTWADFWDVKRFPGKRGLRRTPKYTLEIALMADGVKPADVYKVLSTPQGVARALRKLDAIKPYVVWWSSISQVPDLLASGEISMSVTSPGRLVVANHNEHRNFKLAWDQNIYAVDFWAILNGGPRQAEALKLIRYMGEPENQVRLAKLIPTGLTNKKGIALAGPQLEQETPLGAGHMERALELDARFWVENADQLTQQFNAWLAR